MIYPVEALCFTKSFDWALSLDTIKYLNTHYEIWSKGGMGPGFSIDNKEKYLENFNWISHWIEIYFFGKFTDYILVILIITIIFASFFYKELKNKKINKLQFNKNLFLFYFLLLIIFLIWFLNFPTLRYSGYAIVFLLIIFPISFYLSGKIDLSNKNILKKISIIFFISYTIFVYKNVSRIYDEFQLSKIDHNNFKDFPFYWIDKNKFKEVLVDNHYLYLTQGKCWATPSTCVRSVDSLKITKKNSYIFYIIKK